MTGFEQYVVDDWMDGGVLLCSPIAEAPITSAKLDAGRQMEWLLTASKLLVGVAIGATLASAVTGPHNAAFGLVGARTAQSPPDYGEDGVPDGHWNRVLAKVATWRATGPDSDVDLEPII